MVIKNLENKIKLVGIICSAFLVGCVIISVSSIWTARRMVGDAQQKVYVLDGNVPILVNRTTMEETLDVEAKSHIEMFHHYFFTLAPDDKYIRYSMEKAMYLVDETGLAQYNTLKEKGFYNNIMGTSAVFSIFCDSIRFDKDKMEFTYYGRQRIERRSNILMRELVTAGQVKRVPRTENNPHGLLITNWRTLLNKALAEARLRGQTAAAAPVAVDTTQSEPPQEQIEIKGQIAEDGKAVKALDEEEKPQEVVRKVKITSDYFNTLSQNEHEPKLIKAIIDEDIKATDGSRVRLRLLDDIEIGETVVRKGSYLYATMSGFGS